MHLVLIFCYFIYWLVTLLHNLSSDCFFLCCIPTLNEVDSCLLFDGYTFHVTYWWLTPESPSIALSQRGLLLPSLCLLSGVGNILSLISRCYKSLLLVAQFRGILKGHSRSWEWLITLLQLHPSSNSFSAQSCFLYSLIGVISTTTSHLTFCI